MRAEYCGNTGCLQRDSAEHEEYAGARSAGPREGGERGGTDLLERILDEGNLNRAFKRVKANNGAPGIDKMTIEEAQDWLRWNQAQLVEALRNGTYKPIPVRRKGIPKPDGGVRLLGIPTVIDRVIQQAIAQKLTPIYDPTFAETSFGYRPGRSAQQAIGTVKKFAEEGYTQVASLDLSKYFDTINHDMLLNILRERIQDERVIQLIKRFLKAGVMEDGICKPTEEGSPQGGPLSPLISNIYLDRFDKLMDERGVRFVRYADDINIFAKSRRAAQRLMEHAKEYLEGCLKLRMNAEKSKVVSVYSPKRFKFLGFALGKNSKGVYIRAHPKALKKAKAKLKRLSARNQGCNVGVAMRKVEVYMTGWLGYFGIASIKTTLKEWDSWLRRRFRAFIWKQWKRPRTKVESLMRLGINEDEARAHGYSRKKYWRLSRTPAVNAALTNERLEGMGYMNLSKHYIARHSSG